MTYHKAWRVKQHKDAEDCLYVLAPTASKAKSHVYKSEYNTGDWYLDYACCRVPQLDYDDEAEIGGPYEEPLTFFSVHKERLMRMDCAVCGRDVKDRGYSQWPNPWTAYCYDCRYDDTPPIIRTQADYQPVYPHAPMVWVGSDE